MQQRLCSCGCTIWVRYLRPNRNCRVIFYWKGDNRGNRLTRCPRCGKRLDIDTLY